jgi:hypothetical protein
MIDLHCRDGESGLFDRLDKRIALHGAADTSRPEGRIAG